MVYGIYQSAAGMQVNQYRQDVLANNLANVATPAFKPDIAVVRERPLEARDGGDPTMSADVLSGLTGGSFVSPTYTAWAPATVETTGNPLDVALPEAGFFMVRDGDQTRYTRDGRFTLNKQGELVTVAGGLPVLSESGATITLPANATGKARIDATGEVRSGRQGFGKIGVVSFEDTSNLRKVGKNLVEAFDKPQSTGGRIQVGAVEQSGVDPTQAMVSMIEVSRAYQLNATLAGLADSTLGRAVNDIARLK